MKLMLMLFAVSTLCCVSSADENIEKKSLVGFWEFKEGAGDVIKDSSPNGNNGKIMSAEACQWSREDDRGFFLVIDNKSNSDSAHVRVEDNPSIKFSKEFSIIAYFSCDLNACDKQFCYANILAKGKDYNDGYSIMVSKDGDLVVTLKGLEPADLYFNAGIKSNIENVVAVMYDGTSVKAYLNGKSLGERKVSGILTDNNSPLYMGNYPHQRYKFKGNMYTVKMYNKALDEAGLKAAFKGNLKSDIAASDAKTKISYVKPGEKPDKPGTVYFNQFDKMEPRGSIIDDRSPSDMSHLEKWQIRRNVNFIPGSPDILHPPVSSIPEQDLSYFPDLKGKYDIFIGMRNIMYKTKVQLKTSGMKDYATAMPPVPDGEKYDNFEILALENIDMSGQKILIHPCGYNAYIGYVKFVPADTMTTAEKALYLKAKIENKITANDYFNELSREDLKERVYVEKNKMPELSSRQKTQGYVLFPVNWQKLIFPVSVPDKNYENLTLTLSASKGEYEPVSFCIRALEDLKDLSLKKTASFKNAKGGKLDCDMDIGIVENMLKHSKNFSGKNPEAINGPQYIEQFKTISIHKDQTRQFWITFKVPETASPGLYKGNLLLSCENKTDLIIPVELEVYPFSLEKLTGINIGLFSGLRSLNGISIESELADMKEHGMTSIFVTHKDLIKIKGDSPSALKIDFENSKITEVVKGMKKLNYSGDLFFKTDDILNYSKKFPDEKDFETAYVNIVKQLEDYAKSNNWPKLIYQSFDEILSSPKNLPEFIKEMTLLKKAGVTTEHDHMWYKSSRPLQEQIDKCVNLVDIFLLRYNSRSLFYVDSWEEILKKCKELNKDIYSYNTDNASVFPDPSAMRFIGGWFFKTVGDGCKGQFIYSYQDFSGSPYNDFDGAGDADWLYMYPSMGGSKGGPSIKWEALREGIDDLKYIATLEKLIKEAKSKGKFEVAGKGEKVLDEIKKSFDIALMKGKCVFLEQKWGEEWSGDNGKLFCAGEYTLPNGWSFDKYDEARKQIAQKIIELSQ